jgi:type VII secretion protein EccB
MATTREQAEAYSYANRRMSTSLMRGADEARLDPRRRLNRALGSGVAIGVLIMAGFGIAGWLGGGSGPDLPTTGAVVVGGSGDRYLVEDGVVHPALNLASAMLVGGDEPTEVRQETLDAAPRGLPVGIPGAPDALPDAEALVDEDWTACVTPSETGGDPIETVLYVSIPGIAPAATDDGGATVLVEAADGGGLWLLTEGRRYEVNEDVLGRLGLWEEPVYLPREIVATVPEGPAITIPRVPGDAGGAPAVDLPFDAEVGDVALTEEAVPTRQYFLVREDGVVAVSELVFSLLAGEGRASHEISAAEAVRAEDSAEEPPGDPAWPEARPVVDEPERDQPVCVSTPPGSRPGDAPWQATVHLPATMPAPEDVTPIEAASGDRMGMLDRIYVPAGAGAVVRAATSAATGGTYTLVTDGGTAYPFASPEAVERLGYLPDEAPSVPLAYVGLLPVGPALDPDRANQEQHGESGAGW